MLSNQLHRLPTGKIIEIHKVMQEAALASELRGHQQSRLIFRRAKNQAVGMQKRIYALMESADPRQIEVMKDCLLEILS